MADKFDPYREALVMETETIWPEGHDEDHRRQAELATLLHADPAEAEQLEYIRTHTGFCRRIVVTEADLERVAAQAG